MKDLFIADAHLLDPEDTNYQRLLAFLESRRGRIRNLVILGDLFEFWVGYREVVFSRYLPLLELLHRLHREGARITYVEGNHDFHLGPWFAQKLGCRILPDGGDIEIDGRRFHLAHGDLLNPADTAYLRLRWILRSRLLRGLIAAVPPDLTWRISRAMARRSAGRKKERPAFDPTPLLVTYAEKKIAEGADFVLTGHFHRPMELSIGKGKLVALGDWITDFSYAVHDNGALSLHSAADESPASVTSG
ncbi:UDP-2,3-diacylglucosamine hydrolase [Geothermobacter ehrlichii]|uniref:UDP-2,3-diacylglucosamine hydrolase n=1 Tax=Geothermobacter ehrlichii TaxID=213224 RepID=A0A5D3WKA5_9BACT|nr:UDP-2,3-diacylglucosamine diphosphatase [Geothermobacter ehrlichii]TYO98788.1 UDP-2,3-diacylglucosamine hydrolase [Geothermobacter ehrlichii]